MRMTIYAAMIIALTLSLMSARSDAAEPTAKGGDAVYPFAMDSNGQILTNPAYAPAMLDAGATICRIDVSFKTVRAKPGNDPDQWDWSQLENVRKVRKLHPQLRFEVILGYGTDWAGDEKWKDPTGKRQGTSWPMRGIDVRPVESPENLYGHFVYEAVRRYKDVVDLWESWNEPDLGGHHYFRGDGTDFMPYQRTFYLAAKKADPNCVALFAGLCFPSIEGYLHAHGYVAPSPTPTPESFFEQYLKAVVKDPQAKTNNYYFDLMNQHSYSRASDLYEYPLVLDKLMSEYLGAAKPIWITEMGTTDKGGLFGGTEDEYCDYILQSYAWGMMGGVQKFFHFQLDNSNGHGLYSSMLGKPKPVLTTYRDILTREFARARFVKQLHGTRGVGFMEGHSAYKPTWKAGYNLFAFRDDQDNRLLYIAFADTDKAVNIEIPARAAQATLVDRHNQRKQVKAENGVYHVTLDGATNLAGWAAAKNNAAAQALGQPEHLVGGATIVLIEQGGK